MVIGKLAGRFPQLSLIWADGGYAGKLIGWVGRADGLDLGDSEASWGTQLRGVAPQMGGGADFRLAGPVPQAEQGLRSLARNYRILGVHSHDSSHAPATGPGLNNFGNTL